MSDLRTAALRALEALRMFREWEMGQDYDSNRDTVLARAFEAEASLAEALKDTPPQERGCRVCGIGANGTVFGYVCQRTDCPVGITCGV